MSELILEERKCIAFSKSISKEIEILRMSGKVFFWRIPINTYALFYNSLKGLLLIRKLRKTFSICKVECSEPKCMKVDRVKLIRDNYIIFDEEMSKIPVMNFFVGGLVEKTLAAWDDLVEDMTIGSDTEFRDLIMQIVEKAA